MKTPTSPATINEPLFGYPEDTEDFRVPHITTTENTKTGEKIARTEVNGKVYEARHPYDAGRAAEALGAEVSRLNRRGAFASGVIR